MSAFDPLTSTEDDIRKFVEDNILAELMKADANNDGCLTLEEVIKYSTEVKKEPFDEKDQEMFKAMDKNNDGKLEKDEIMDFFMDMMKK